MIIQFFKNNNPVAYILLPLISIALWIPGFFIENKIDIVHGMPLYDLLIEPISAIPLLSTIIAITLVIGGAFTLNTVINENETIATPTFLPAFFYILFMSCSKSLLLLHPILIANFFILFAINKLNSSYRKDIAFSQAFDAGFLCAIASLFFLPYIVFVPLLFIGLQLFRPFIWREWMITFLGLLFPYLFVFTYYFWNDLLEYLWYDKIYYSLINTNSAIELNFSHYFMLFSGLLIATLSVLKLFNGFSGSQKNKQGMALLIWLLLFAVAAALITTNLPDHYFWFISIPIATFATNYFIQLKKQLAGELILLLFIIAIIINNSVN